MKKIFIASDHAGFELKSFLVQQLKNKFSVVDLGAESTDSVDYPVYAQSLSKSVLDDQNSIGILMCGSGIGMSISANRFKGIRAALVWNEEIAKLSRQHNNSNVLVLPARFMTKEEALKIVLSWIQTEFEGGRHEKRVLKIETL